MSKYILFMRKNSDFVRNFPEIIFAIGGYDRYIPVMQKEITVTRDGATEIFSGSWRGPNRILRYCARKSAGNEPFYSTVYPVYGSEIERIDSPAWYRFRNMQEMTLELLLSGIMRYEQNGISEIVRPGEIYIIHKGSDTRFEQLPGDSMHRIRLMIRGDLVSPLIRSLRLEAIRIVPVRDPESMADRFRHLIDLLNGYLPESGAEISGLTCCLLTEIAEEAGRKKQLPENLENILREISDDTAYRLSIAELARRHGCGVHTLMRLFHRHLGVSPSEYRERLRHERACRLLQSPLFSIKEISDQLGYCNQLYFSAAFKKRSGLSPQAYRRTHWHGE